MDGQIELRRTGFFEDRMQQLKRRRREEQAILLMLPQRANEDVCAMVPSPDYTRLKTEWIVPPLPPAWKRIGPGSTLQPATQGNSTGRSGRDSDAPLWLEIS